MFKLPWIEKYRPKNMDEVIGHDKKINTLRNLIKRDELTHLLFYGSPGLGKTSLALSLARELYGENYPMYILELNASDERGIDVVRNKIPNFIRSKSDKIKMVILDEADAMTLEAQNAIRRVMENATKNSRFILICNNIKKIIPEIQSRCVKMRFSPLDPEQIRDRLNYIISEEGVKISADALELMITHLKDFRQILNSLVCLHFSNSLQDRQISVEDVIESLGIPSNTVIADVYENLMKQPFQKVVNYLKNLLNENEWNLEEMVGQLAKKIVTDNSLNDDIKYYLLGKLSQIDCRIVIGRDSEIQLLSLVSAFVRGRQKYQ